MGLRRVRRNSVNIFHIRPIDSDHLRPLDPISEGCFNDIAFLVVESTVTLDRLSQMDWRSHLGVLRSMYISLESGLLITWWRKSNLYLFCQAEVGCWLANLPSSVRLHLRLSPASPCASLSSSTPRQCPAPMPVCRSSVMRPRLAATTVFEQSLTPAGSGPLPPEAAFKHLNQSERKSMAHLANHSDLNSLDRGRRAMRRRWMSINHFMEALPQCRYSKPFRQHFQHFRTTKRRPCSLGTTE
ncbi:hypothetical protein F5148DRAFT_941779 [Russula earlei]|uniref:Uncharacterized protein n=1 Tax=Russula earlei TaxID=71964 RepID=A0ACC0U981_9AGAM|nr:hypothetical protein F5148DRAFT_941779 [Russula earlei]